MAGILTMLAGNDTKIVQLVTTNGTGSFTAPTGYGLVTVEAIAGGGRGIGSAINNQRAGGGGGAYACATSISVTGGTTIVYYTVGGMTTDSWVNVGTNSAPTTLTVGCVAKAGANATSGVAGIGGGTTLSIGNIKFAGGNGGLTSSGDGGGGGGINGAGVGRVAGTIAPMGDGGGGTLSIGLIPGGGGGPALVGGTNRSGAIGRVRITFYNEVWR